MANKTKIKGTLDADILTQAGAPLPTPISGFERIVTVEPGGLADYETLEDALAAITAAGDAAEDNRYLIVAYGDIETGNIDWVNWVSLNAVNALIRPTGTYATITIPTAVTDADFICGRFLNVKFGAADAGFSTLRKYGLFFFGLRGVMNSHSNAKQFINSNDSNTYAKDCQAFVFADGGPNQFFALAGDVHGVTVFDNCHVHIDSDNTTGDGAFRLFGQAGSNGSMHVLNCSVLIEDHQYARAVTIDCPSSGVPLFTIAGGSFEIVDPDNASPVIGINNGEPNADSLIVGATLIHRGTSAFAYCIQGDSGIVWDKLIDCTLVYNGSNGNGVSEIVPMAATAAKGTNNAFAL